MGRERDLPLMPHAPLSRRAALPLSALPFSSFAPLPRVCCTSLLFGWRALRRGVAAAAALRCRGFLPVPQHFGALRLTSCCHLRSFLTCGSVVVGSFLAFADERRFADGSA